LIWWFDFRLTPSFVIFQVAKKFTADVVKSDSKIIISLLLSKLSKNPGYFFLLQEKNELINFIGTETESMKI